MSIIGLSAGFQPNTQLTPKANLEGEVSLFDAVTKGDINRVADLIQYGADINAPCNELGETPLHIAAGGESLEMVEFLLGHEATVNKEDYFHRSPLAKAVSSDKLAIAELLLSRGAMLLQKDLFVGQPIIHNATSQKMVHFLVQKGADINARNI